MIRARVIAEPASECISLEEAYMHLRVDPIDSSDVTGRPDDPLIQSLIVAARQYCENFTGLALGLTDYEAVLNAWPDDDVIELPHPPFVALLGGIVVRDDTSDNAIDESLYSIDSETADFALLSPVSQWPVLADGNRIVIRWRAGYGDESEAFDMPGSIKQAMLLLLGHWYSNREAVVVGTISGVLSLAVESLLRPHRVLLGMA